MNIEKIEINGHYVWVDKDAEIKEGDYLVILRHFEQGIPIHKSKVNGKVSVDDAKIIAASLELNLEGIPTYVEYLAEQEYPSAHFGLSIETARERKGFIKGYQTAEKELLPIIASLREEVKMGDEALMNEPTWDDVRKAIEMARDQYWDVDNRGFSTHTDGDWSFKHSEEEIIEQLKQSKK